jgi:hypothetical protein
LIIPQNAEAHSFRVQCLKQCHEKVTKQYGLRPQWLRQNYLHFSPI